jgi:hypothetical protein
MERSIALGPSYSNCESASTPTISLQRVVALLKSAFSAPMMASDDKRSE